MRTSWSLEPGSRTLRAETDLPNPQGQYRPGMYLTARVTNELPANWTVPNSAMVKLNDEPCLFLLEDGVARKHVVQLAVGDHERTQIKGYRNQQLRLGRKSLARNSCWNQQLASPMARK